MTNIFRMNWKIFPATGISPHPAVTPVQQPQGKNTAMSRWSRVLGAAAGVVMVVGGLLGLEGYGWGWVLGAAAAAAGAFVVSGALGAGKRSGKQRPF
jgi:hypothetical protein